MKLCMLPYTHLCTHSDFILVLGILDDLTFWPDMLRMVSFEMAKLLCLVCVTARKSWHLINFACQYVESPASFYTKCRYGKCTCFLTC